MLLNIGGMEHLLVTVSAKFQTSLVPLFFILRLQTNYQPLPSSMEGEDMKDNKHSRAFISKVINVSYQNALPLYFLPPVYYSSFMFISFRELFMTEIKIMVTQLTTSPYIEFYDLYICAYKS